MGVLGLRRRLEPTLGVDVFEVKLDDEFLMSSLFTEAEVQLAKLGLAGIAGDGLDVVVGGLGLGYTASAVLDDPRVAEVLVVEALAEVIGWHEDGLLPASERLVSDGRARLVRGDFFALAASPGGFDTAAGGRRFDAILVDIDHSPQHVLDASHAGFYSESGLGELSCHLRPGGVFALWSDDPPHEGFLALLDQVLATADAHVVSFPNPFTGGSSANTVYVAASASTG